ncbi:hypothetical protein BESB_061050 [Besnoitia besnoiti]|uniref:AMMECR1 domain-containing protein n=1 Tax=Besnoitia besnoiti TaxID=94643 RepID=A0A2A9M9R2_BESBE|nr:hypothetical protein BESB_061050 [Besnoitia besnoiti]PFH35218.1 hypothetical protein BESB_061050 [Besnoitia besnoiti]
MHSIFQSSLLQGRLVSLLAAAGAALCLPVCLSHFDTAVLFCQASEPILEQDSVEQASVPATEEREDSSAPPPSTADSEPSLPSIVDSTQISDSQEADNSTEDMLINLLQEYGYQPSSLLLSLLRRRRGMWASPGCKNVDMTTDFVRWGYDILIDALQNGGEEDIRVPTGIVEMQQKGLRCPAFFSWYQRDPDAPDESQDSYDLRGCVGTLAAITPKEIGNYALLAAEEDPRFAPITLSEVPTLKGVATILHSFETAKGPMDWELGVHGLATEFVVNGLRYSGVFLPQVLEQFETKENGIIQLIRKAQYSGQISKELINSMRLTRFQGKFLSLSFPEYEAEFGVIGQPSRVLREEETSDGSEADPQDASDNEGDREAFEGGGPAATENAEDAENAAPPAAGESMDEDKQEPTETEG